PVERDGLLGATWRVRLGVEIEHEFAALEVGEREAAAAVTREGESRRFIADAEDRHVPSFRRFHRVNVTRDEMLVKGWRGRGNFCGSATFGPTAGAPEFEVGVLGREGMSG